MEGIIKERSKLIKVRKWEDLNTDCLINIFGRLGLESLILYIPYVCKSWYKASFDPHCWKLLDFQPLPVRRSTEDTRPICKVFPCTQFMKIAVNRSAGLATDLVFHTSNLQDNILEYILDRCPALNTLTLPGPKNYYCLKRKENVVIENGECLLKMMRKLPNLESLMTLITDDGKLVELILNQIHIHCPNLVSLGLQDFVNDDIAFTLVTLFPNIKHLVLSGSLVRLESLVHILSGCQKLELLDVRNCIGFNHDDYDLFNWASHIKTFKPEGCRILFL